MDFNSSDASISALDIGSENFLDAESVIKRIRAQVSGALDAILDQSSAETTDMFDPGLSGGFSSRPSLVGDLSHMVASVEIRALEISPTTPGGGSATEEPDVEEPDINDHPGGGSATEDPDVEEPDINDHPGGSSATEELGNVDSDNEGANDQLGMMANIFDLGGMYGELDSFNSAVGHGNASSAGLSSAYASDFDLF